MKEAVDRIIVIAQVGEPDAVEVAESGDGKNVRIEVRVADHDMGRGIGREGRTVKAIRSILFVAGAKARQALSARSARGLGPSVSQFMSAAARSLFRRTENRFVWKNLVAIAKIVKTRGLKGELSPTS